MDNNELLVVNNKLLVDNNKLLVVNSNKMLVDNKHRPKVVNSKQLVDNSNQKVANKLEDNNKLHNRNPTSKFKVITSSPEILAEDLLMPNTRESHQLGSHLTLMTNS